MEGRLMEAWTTTTTAMEGLCRPSTKKARVTPRAHKEYLMQGINDASQRQHQSRPSL